MRRSRIIIISILSLLMTTYLTVNASTVNASSVLLKKGHRSDKVRQLQDDLKRLGYFNANSTGYYGSVTEGAVRGFQSDHGLLTDGIAGENTLSTIVAALPSTYAESCLKKGMMGSNVKNLQRNLKSLGYFDADVTGYYGSITKNAVREFQAENGLNADGVAGENTLTALLQVLSGKDVTKQVAVSRSSDDRSANYLMPWFNGVENIFKRGSIATVYDVETGISFQVKRTFGTNHADSEPLTAADTAAMKKAYGGSWSWVRRAIIVEVGGMRFAASMNGMPHAGLEKYAAGASVSGRSGGYGYGYNYDAIKGNNFNGHFCIHFYNSRTHGTNRVDPKHSQMVQKAARWAESN